MGLDSLPPEQRRVVCESVKDFMPHDDFPACYAGTCACEHETRQLLAAFYERMRRTLVKEAEGQ